MNLFLTLTALLFFSLCGAAPWWSDVTLNMNAVHSRSLPYSALLCDSYAPDSYL